MAELHGGLHLLVYIVGVAAKERMQRAEKLAQWMKSSCLGMPCNIGQWGR